VLTVGAILVFRGSMTVGSLVAFYTVSTGLGFSVANMTWSMPYFISASSGLRRIEAALAQEPEVNDAPGARPLDFRGALAPPRRPHFWRKRRESDEAAH
jgi:ATP-binding cassette subfamily B protein